MQDFIDELIQLIEKEWKKAELLKVRDKNRKDGFPVYETILSKEERYVLVIFNTYDNVVKIVCQKFLTSEELDSYKYVSNETDLVKKLPRHRINMIIIERLEDGHYKLAETNKTHTVSTKIALKPAMLISQIKHCLGGLEGIITFEDRQQGFQIEEY